MIYIRPYYVAWYVRLWRWVCGGFKRKQPIPRDPYFDAIVEVHHFNGPNEPSEAPK